VNTDPHDIARSFDLRAPDYRRSDWHRRSAQRLVALTPLRAGDRVLDACTGTGFAALAAAGVAGNEGHVSGVDISAGMLRQAHLALRESGLTNLEFILADASDLPQFSSATFDVVICATGLLYMPYLQALREWHRLLKPGGIVAFSNMAAGSPRAAAIFRQSAAGFGVTLDDPTAPLGTTSACRTALEDTGFGLDRIVSETIEFSDEDLRHAWESNVGSAAYAATRGLPAPQLDALKSEFLAAFEREPRDALTRAEMLYVIGVRP
jgi:ubiquinone/menaquinone biosynthesis C-methylase UbiE